MNERKPVSPEVYEELKMLAALRENCVLQFYASNGGAVTLQTVISQVYAEDDGQYLIAANGAIIQLPQLISVNGKPLEYFC